MKIPVFIHQTKDEIFLDNSGNFSRIYTDGSTADRECMFYPWTHEMGLLIFPMPNNQYDKIFIFF